MPRPQIITSSGGEEMAVIPMAEYEALVRAAGNDADVRAYDEAKRRLAAGEEEQVPAEFAERILDGENPVRVWREYRRRSVKDLAEQAGISPAYLSQIETGKREGTLSTMRAIADALGLTLDDLAL